jgi:hypothetical protein
LGSLPCMFRDAVCLRKKPKAPLHVRCFVTGVIFT